MVRAKKKLPPLGEIKALGDGRYRLTGDLTFDTVSRVLDQSEDLFQGEDQRLELDLADVNRADSAGLALLMEWTRLARRRSVDIQFVNVPEQMAAVAKLTGLDTVLAIR